MARAAGGRQRRLVGRRGGERDPRDRGATTSSSSSSRAARSRSWPRCAAACPRRSPPTSRSPAPSDVRARGRARGLRRRERQARRRAAASDPRARRCARRARARAGRLPVEHARRPLGDRRRAAAGGVGGRVAGLRAGHARAVRRASSPAPCPRPRRALMRVPQGPGLGVERRRRLSSAEVLRRGSRPVAPRPARRAAGAAARARRRPRSPRGRAGALGHPPRGRGVALVARARRSASSGSSSARSSSQTGSSTPWPAVRSSIASSRGSWLRRPGRWSSTSASDWSANSGWRSQSSTIVLDRLRSPSRRRAARRPPRARSRVAGLVDARPMAPTVTRPRVAARGRAARRAAPAGRPASSRTAPRPRPPSAISRRRPSKVCSRWSSRTLG